MPGFTGSYCCFAAFPGFIRGCILLICGRAEKRKSGAGGGENGKRVAALVPENVEGDEMETVFAGTFTRKLCSVFGGRRLHNFPAAPCTVQKSLNQGPLA